MTNWKLDAACNVTIHGDLWYRPDGEVDGPARRARVAKAVAICQGCPVLATCTIASDRERAGIWAGVDLDRNPVTKGMSFDTFVETITNVHRAGGGLAEALEATGYERQQFYTKLLRRDRLDLYSMLTGAAA